MASTLAGTSSATRTLDQRDLAALRPVPAPKPRVRKPRREPMARSLTFFCSNPQCEHDTWSPYEQARHMAREFWEVTQALVRLAPESGEALKLTGGVVLRDLTDDELRAAVAEYERVRSAGGVGQLPVAVRLAYREYERRRQAGVLTFAEKYTRRAPLSPKCDKGHDYTAENTAFVPDGKGGRCRQCRTCRRENQRKLRQKPETKAAIAAQSREYRARKKAELGNRTDA